ncbi:MAG: hypothetical protein AMXMBFR13_34420 [Phycisphaerae bacterium]
MPHMACIALGSNLGDRHAHILAAVQQLRASPGIETLLLSRLHETEPVGGPAEQGRYLNAAARLETTLEPLVLLRLLLRVEENLGRVRNERWGPRVIDLDLLLYEEQVITTPELTVPHPRMAEREFVLAPLAEVAPHARHPITGRTVEELLSRLAHQAPGATP